VPYHDHGTTHKKTAGSSRGRFPKVFDVNRDDRQRAARDRLHRAGALYRDGMPDIDRIPAPLSNENATQTTSTGLERSSRAMSTER